MTRPTSIRIGPMDYEIEWMNEADRRGTQYDIGQHDGTLGIIRLADCLKPRLLACVFVHEVMHAVLWWLDHVRDGKVEEEQVCNCAGYGLADVWIDNPDVFAWYCGLLGVAQ